MEQLLLLVSALGLVLFVLLVVRVAAHRTRAAYRQERYGRTSSHGDGGWLGDGSSHRHHHDSTSSSDSSSSWWDSGSSSDGGSSWGGDSGGSSGGGD